MRSVGARLKAGSIRGGLGPAARFFGVALSRVWTKIRTRILIVLIRAGRRLPERNLVTRAGIYDDACERGKRGRLSRRTGPGKAAAPFSALRRRLRASCLSAVGGAGSPPPLRSAVALAIVGTIALTLQHLRFERDLALQSAAREVGMRATILAARLDAALGGCSPGLAGRSAPPGSRRPSRRATGGGAHGRSQRSADRD